MFCKYCGTELGENAAFCHHCETSTNNSRDSDVIQQSNTICDTNHQTNINKYFLMKRLRNAKNLSIAAMIFSVISLIGLFSLSTLIMIQLLIGANLSSKLNSLSAEVVGESSLTVLSGSAIKGYSSIATMPLFWIITIAIVLFAVLLIVSFGLLPMNIRQLNRFLIAIEQNPTDETIKDYFSYFDIKPSIVLIIISVLQIFTIFSIIAVVLQILSGFAVIKYYNVSKTH